MMDTTPAHHALQTVWSPNPHSSITSNWKDYAQAAKQQGQLPNDEEFAKLWWQKERSGC